MKTVYIQMFTKRNAKMLDGCYKYDLLQIVSTVKIHTFQNTSHLVSKLDVQM